MNAQDSGQATHDDGGSTAAFRVDLVGDPDTGAAASAVSAVDELGNGSALLVVKRGPNAGTQFRLDQPITTAGRHPESDIFLDDVTASRRHAEFRRENGHVELIDTGSLNGTYVNRKPVQSAVLADGDEIQIGKFRLLFLINPE